jgi:methylmalonyl-CoA mutase N-terminal domain/subunit
VKFSVQFSPLERISRFGDKRCQDNGKIGTSGHLLLFRDRILAKGYWKKVLDEIKQERKAPPTTFDKKQLAKIKQERVRWESKTLKPWTRASPEQKEEFRNLSNIPVKRVYTPEDVSHLNESKEIGLPGEYPYVRGVYPTMYRGRPWTMRMFSGFGTPEDTNKRLHYLLEHGETGLSIAFDMPTLYGYDPDSQRAEGEVGRCGVSVGSLKDMEIILEGIPLEKVSTSMTINAPASVLTAMYVGVAERQGVKPKELRGTVQADILKEYIAQKEWAFPPEAHLRIIRDMMVYCTKEMPQWNYISISGYHIREAGSSAVQELAFTLADGFAYVDLGIEAGLKIEDFAPRLSFFFNCGMDFFEEVAKFRAARRIWARVLRDKYNVKDPRSLLLRTHAQNSGASLTWQQPLNNIVRTTIEALATVLGGTQSLHTNSYDEAWALPSEAAATVALRTQQIIADETGVTDTIDPLAGSYYLEWLTDEMEERAYQYFDKIERAGGLLDAIKTGFIQREIAENSYRFQQELEKGDRVVVGVNKYQVEEKKPIDTLKINEEAQRRQIARIDMVRQTRDNKKVEQALDELRKTFMDEKANSMYPMVKAVKAYATLGEIMDVGRKIFGEYKEPPIL